MELKELTDKTLQLFHVTDVADLGKALMEHLDDKDKRRRSKTDLVKHAHWIINAQPGTKGEPDFVCSSCFCISPIRGYARYCPNCGALMDGEVEGRKKK